MKSRSHRLPIIEPPDDWGDGSWTVDCVCGVNFDDGEEMVNCDECGVWVHTRCSRFVKGETSFACDKCKTKKNRNDNEETEVAQLLVELPTKTLRMDNPYPSSAPPRPSFRLWTDIPIEERVHVQGVPGGDPALFQGLSSVFTSELWKCSGYVPKKFNFQYREFPCWDEERGTGARVEEENENPVDRGADALFSLSKEIVSANPVEMLVGLRGSVEGASRERKPSQAKKRESNDSRVGHVRNGVARETNHYRPSGHHSGKRKKDDTGGSKDSSGKKKARSVDKPVDSKKRASRTATGPQQVEFHEDGLFKVVVKDYQDTENGHKTTILDADRDGCLEATNNSNKPKENLATNAHQYRDEDCSKKTRPEDNLAANAHHAEDSFKKAKTKDKSADNSHHAEDSNKGKPKDNLVSDAQHAEDSLKKAKPTDSLAPNAHHGEDTPKEAMRHTFIGKVVKSENEHRAPMKTGCSPETVDVAVSLFDPKDVSTIMKLEDLNTHVDCLDHLKDEKHDPPELIVSSSSIAMDSHKSKLPVGDLRNADPEVQDSSIPQDSSGRTSPSSLRSDIKVKPEANEDQRRGDSRVLSSPVIDVKLDDTKHLDQHQMSGSAHPSEDLQVHETSKINFPSGDNEVQDAIRESKALSCCDKEDIVEDMFPISGEPCDNGVVKGSTGTISVQESSSESKHLKNVEESSEKGQINPSPSASLTTHKVVVGFGKSSSASSSVLISKSAGSGSCKPPGRPASPNTLRSIHLTKRVKVNSCADIKKDHTENDAVRDDTRHEEPRKKAREQGKASATSGTKPLHTTRISYASTSKRTLSDSKDSVLYPSSKSLLAQNVVVSSGSVESASIIQSQSVPHVQNKTTASGFSQKGEKFNQSSSQQSSKVTHSSSMHPPAPVNSSSTLSDEELALLLHQELNSSPRVPRVPRMRHTGSIPQLASPTATSMLIKRTSSSGVKDHILVSRRKSKEDAPKDVCRSSRELNEETKKIERLLSSPDHRKQDPILTSDGSTKKEALGGSTEVGHSAKKNVPLPSTSTFGPSSSTEATVQNLSSLRNSPRGNTDDDSGDGDDDDDAGGIAGPATRTLPGLIDEIMSKGRRMTYEELCNAVLPHWHNLRKHNGERYAYSSHSQAVLDCLRNRNEWAQLVDRGPKTNAGRKKRKLDCEPPLVESEENEYGKGRTSKESELKNIETHREDFPKGKRKARKRRRLALQGRGIRDVRKKRKAKVVTDDDTGPFSDSSEDDGIFSEDASQGARTCPIESEASTSSDEAGST